MDLTLTLPPALAAVSGLNAMAHAVEALYAPDGNPVTALMAEEAVAALGRSLPRVVADPADRAARTDALYGAWLAACCLGAVAMGLHHKLCHALGGGFGLPHAETHAVVLPYAVAFNAPAAPGAMARVARALGTTEAATALWELGRRLGAPPSLAAIGLREADLDRAVALATGAPYPNPRPVTPDAVRRLLADALAGGPPTSRPQPVP